MGAAVELGSNTGICPYDFHIAFCIDNRNCYLIADSSAGKGCEALNPGLEAIAGKAGRNGGHILLGNTAIEHLFRETIIKRSCSAGFCEIRIQHTDMAVFLHQLRKAAGVNSSHFHCFIPPPAMLQLQHLPALP